MEKNSDKINKMRHFTLGVLTPLLMLTILFGALPERAIARDMHGRLGLGYNAEFANTLAADGVPGISLKYGLTRDIAAALVIGGKTSNPLNSVTAIKFFKNMFFENNLNFYFMLAGGIISAGNGAAAEFLGGLGAEFFIPGLESLGFSFETGVSFNNASGSFLLKTIGASPLNAGIHFYF